ncbi:DUF29 domain-containing protein [Endozoicomonas sp. 8E]|uniref:DUF29 domain-containing protein n=1 Tax=Endozoicomonas sp. 8E TaxID=3035692 RepID=UPI0029391BBB|nr:DUF29 domain-containing protein [Endozoicomonas sp. 8E]WOG29819.1 DUF29 domain-containing protein [Endozoicomonas sp. 8E]
MAEEWYPFNGVNIMSNLYETDYQQWLSNQVALLRNHHFDQLDLENLLEDLELGIESKVDNLERFLTNLILHLLKCDYQTTVLRDSVATERVINGWLNSIDNARREINKLMRKNACLERRVEGALNGAYPDAKEGAIGEMNRHIPTKCPKLDNSSFPDTCPWSYEKLMEKDWYPLNGVEL